jgi:hypothetical protein
MNGPRPVGRLRRLRCPWTDGHVCEIGPASHLGPPLRARIQRLDRGNDLEVVHDPPVSS